MHLLTLIRRTVYKHKDIKYWWCNTCLNLKTVLCCRLFLFDVLEILVSTGKIPSIENMWCTYWTLKPCFHIIIESLAVVEGCWGSLAVFVVGWFPHDHWGSFLNFSPHWVWAIFGGIHRIDGRWGSLRVVCMLRNQVSQSLWVVVGRCGSLWVGVGRCGSVWVGVARWNRKQFYSNDPVVDSRWGFGAVFVKLEAGFYMIIEGR